MTHQKTNEDLSEEAEPGEQAAVCEEAEPGEQAAVCEQAELGEQVAVCEEAQPGEQAAVCEEDLINEENQRIVQDMATIDSMIRAMDNLKSFRGTPQENSRDWLDRAEIVFNAYNVNDVNRLARIGIKFEDSAFDWYRDNQGPYPSWYAFRQAFERAFPPPEPTKNKHLLAEKISQRKQGIDESVHDYFYALDQLCRQYDPQMSVLDKTIRLVGGLRDELKEKLLPLNIRTPDDFLAQAKNYESSQQVMNQQRRTNECVELLEPTYVYEHNQYSTKAAMKQVHQQCSQFDHRQHPQFDHRQHPQFDHQQHSQFNHRQHPQFDNQQHSQFDHRQHSRIGSQQQRAAPYRREYVQRQLPNHRTSSNQAAPNDHPNSNTNTRLCYTCRKPGHFARHCLLHLNESQEQ